MSNHAIVVEDISKVYRIGTAAASSISDIVRNIKKKDLGRSQDTEFWALKDVSFSVDRGEVLGVVGRNGAGKSTLLKILSRITEPTSGRIEINGRMGSLLEVGTGFHPELTGRENIFLNGSILGMKRAEIKARFDEIVEFSGVEKFIDTPVKRYSSGMYVRLAFSVAAHLEPEILIIDEVLAVGDASFQKKCLGKMQEVAKHGRTVLFVSHHMGMVQELCTKGILLYGGKVSFTGTASETVERYTFDNHQQSEVFNSYCSISDSSLIAQILEAKLVDIKGDNCSSIDVFGEVWFTSQYQINEPVKGLAYNIIVERNGETLFMTFDTDRRPELLTNREPGIYKTSFRLPSPLKAGRYTIKFSLGVLRMQGVHNPEKVFTLDVEERTFNESLKSYGSSRIGIIAADLPWEMIQLESQVLAK